MRLQAEFYQKMRRLGEPSFNISSTTFLGVQLMRGGAGVFVNAPDVYFSQGSNKMMFYAYVAALFADVSRV